MWGLQGNLDVIAGIRDWQRLTVAFGLCLLGWPALAAPAQIENVRIAARDQQTRLAIDLSRALDHKVFTLANPHRVVIDLRPGRFARSAQPLPAGVGAVRKIRGANRADGSTRIVLDLNQPLRPTSFVLPPDGRYGHRLVVDLVALNSAPSAPIIAASPPPEERVEAAELPAPAASEPAPTPAPIPGPEQRELVVVVDPGHGGRDPGAAGQAGTREKHVNLQIGRRLAAALDAEDGMRAVLTRDRDEFLPLRERMVRARDASADLFISIHADAFRDRRVRGTTVYVLSAKGASDEASLMLAQRQNASAQIGDVGLMDKDPTLASVLVDLSQNASLSASIDVGESILAELGEFAHLRKRTVQQAPFLVLKSPDVPSLLIETAFISNPQDEKNLVSTRYQQRLADAILVGIREYFYANPPPDTRVAALAARGAKPVGRQYVIRRGDTLSEIAQRYQTSVRRIRSVNGIAGDRIRVGQVLKIPASQDI